MPGVVLDHRDPTAADRATDILTHGGVALLPTDTVYGIAAGPENSEAIRRVFVAKGRPVDHPLPVLVADQTQLASLGVALTAESAALMDRFWPGALTLAFGFRDDATRPTWLGGRTEVAVRQPAGEFIRTLLRRTGPLLVTSANLHGAPTSQEFAEVLHEFDEHVDIAIDAGESRSTPSTLVNVHENPPRVEREGAIQLAELRAVVPSTGLTETNG